MNSADICNARVKINVIGYHLMTYLINKNLFEFNDLFATFCKYCFRYLDFYFLNGERTSPASQKSQDLNKVPLLLQNLGCICTFSWYLISFKDKCKVDKR